MDELFLKIFQLMPYYSLLHNFNNNDGFPSTYCYGALLGVDWLFSQKRQTFDIHIVQNKEVNWRHPV